MQFYCISFHHSFLKKVKCLMPLSYLTALTSFPMLQFLVVSVPNRLDMIVTCFCMRLPFFCIICWLFQCFLFLMILSGCATKYVVPHLVRFHCCSPLMQCPTHKMCAYEWRYVRNTCALSTMQSQGNTNLLIKWYAVVWLQPLNGSQLNFN